MGLGINFYNRHHFSSVLAFSHKQEGSVAQDPLQKALAPLRTLWDQILQGLPDSVLKDPEFLAVKAEFQYALTRQSAEVLGEDLLRIAQSASAWEEFHDFCHQALTWVLDHTQNESLKTRTSRILRQIQNCPDSIQEGFSFLFNDLVRHPVRAELLLGMGAAGLGLRLGRLAGASFSRGGAWGNLGQWASQASLGFGAELIGFSLGTRTAQAFKGERLDWSGRAIGQEMLSGLFLMAPMKWGGSLAQLGRGNGSFRLLQAGSAHYLGAAAGTYASGWVQGQSLNGYQVFSGAAHLMMEGALAGSMLRVGFPKLEQLHRHLEIKTRQVFQRKLLYAADKIEVFWEKSLSKQLELNQALAIEVKDLSGGVSEGKASLIKNSSPGAEISREELHKEGKTETQGAPSPEPSEAHQDHYPEEWGPIRRGLGRRIVQHFSGPEALNDLVNPLDRAPIYIAEERVLLHAFGLDRPTFQYRKHDIPEGELLGIFASEAFLVQWIEIVVDRRWIGLIKKHTDSFSIVVERELKDGKVLYKNPKIYRGSGAIKPGQIKLDFKAFPQDYAIRLAIMRTSDPQDGLANAWLQGRFPGAENRYLAGKALTVKNIVDLVHEYPLPQTPKSTNDQPVPSKKRVESSSPPETKTTANPQEVKPKPEPKFAVSTPKSTNDQPVPSKKRVESSSPPKTKTTTARAETVNPYHPAILDPEYVLNNLRRIK